jgi:hypothetical protein
MSLHADFIHASIEEHLCATVFVAHISRYVGLLLASETNVDYATKFIEVQGELYSQLYDKFCLSYFIPKQEKNESDPF